MVTTAPTTVTRTTIPAERAAAGKMRCARCCGAAKAGGPDFVMERAASFVQTTHEGACPTSSGWGKGR